MVLSGMNWSRQMIQLQTQCRIAEQKARDARNNRRYLPSSCSEEELARLDAGARAAQDAVLAHQMLVAKA